MIPTEGPETQPDYFRLSHRPRLATKVDAKELHIQSGNVKIPSSLALSPSADFVIVQSGRSVVLIIDWPWRFDTTSNPPSSVLPLVVRTSHKAFCVI